MSGNDIRIALGSAFISRDVWNALRKSGLTRDDIRASIREAGLDEIFYLAEAKAELVVVDLKKAEGK